MWNRIGAGLLVVSGFVLLHCGGAVDGQNLADCPTDLTTACVSNSQCVQHFSDCEGTHALTCTCGSSGWKCPQLGAPSCAVDDCKGAGRGVACATEGLFCPAAVQPSCALLKDGCRCQNGVFSCVHTDCLPTCPAPSTITEGGACTTPPSMACDGRFDCLGQLSNVPYQCTGGHWRATAACGGETDGGLPNADF